MNADFITSVPKLRLRSGALGHGPGIALPGPTEHLPDLTAAGESPGADCTWGSLHRPILPPPPLSPDTPGGSPQQCELLGQALVSAYCKTARVDKFLETLYNLRHGVHSYWEEMELMIPR